MVRRPARVAATIVAAALAGCGGEPPTSPTPTPPPPAGPAPAVVRLMGLEIGRPDSVAPGGTAQLTATARLSDGSTRVVTSEVAWVSHNEAVLSVSATGLISARDVRGEANITVRYTGFPEATSGAGFASFDILVLPAGTFRIYGSVRDEGVLASGVRVEVTGGPATGLAVVANGFYRLYGVWGDTEIRVTKDGYEPITRRLEVTRHETVDFALTLVRPREDVSGTYRLTAVADPACRAALPDDTRTRTYTAVVTQQQARVSVSLTGARFVTNGQGVGNRFDGVVEPSRVVFTPFGPFLDEYDYGLSYPSVFEELSPGTYFSLYGKATVMSSSTGYSGTLDGTFSVFRWDGALGFATLAVCEAARHEFSFTR